MAINEDLLFMEVSHQLSLRRFENLTQRQLTAFYRREIAKIDARLMYHVGRGAFTRKRLVRIRKLLRKEITGLNEKAVRRLKRTYNTVTKEEVNYQKRAVETAAAANTAATLGVTAQFNFAIPRPEILRTAAEGNIFQGRNLDRLFKNISSTQLERFDRSLSTSLVQGEGPQSIARRVQREYRRTIQNATATARTGYTAAIEKARDLFNETNNIEFVRYTAVLDERTTFICASRDGKVYKRNEPKPEIPAHYACRSHYFGTFRPDNFSEERLARVSTLGSQRKIGAEMRRRAKLRGTSVKTERRKWQKRVVGRIPGNTTYSKFFKNAPKQFQLNYLGRERYKLYQTGRLDINNLVNQTTGQRFTLKQLRAKDAGAFKAARDVRVPPRPAPGTNLDVGVLRRNLRNDLS